MKLGYRISSFTIITILVLSGLLGVFGIGTLSHMASGVGPVTVVSTAITSCTDCVQLKLNIFNPISHPDRTDQLYVTLSAVGGDEVGYETVASANCPCVQDSWGEMAFLRAVQVSTLDAYVAMYGSNIQSSLSSVTITVTNPIAGNFVLSAIIVEGINPNVNYQVSDNSGDCSGSCSAFLATGMPLANGGLTIVGFAADGSGVAGTITPTPALGFGCVGNCGSNNQLIGGTMEYSTTTGGASSQLPMSYSNGNNGWVLIALTFFGDAGTSFSNTTCQSYCNNGGNSGLSLGQLLWLCQTGVGGAPASPTACGTNSTWNSGSIYDASNKATWPGCSSQQIGCAGYIHNVYPGEWIAWQDTYFSSCAPILSQDYDPVNVSQTTVRNEGGWCIGQIDPATVTHVFVLIIEASFTIALYGAAFALPSGITSQTPYYVLTNSTGRSSTGNVQFSNHYIAGSIYFVEATTNVCVLTFNCTPDTYTAQNGYQQMWQTGYQTSGGTGGVEYGNWAGFISNSEPAPYSEISPAIESHPQYSSGGSNVMIIWWPVGYACTLAPPHVETTGANTTNGFVLPGGVGGYPAAAPYVEATISPNYYCPNDVFMIGAHTNMTNFNGQSFSSVGGFTTTVLRYNYQAPWTTIMAEIQPTTACEFGCAPVHIILSDTHVFEAGIEVVDVHAVSVGTNTTYGTNSTTCGCSVPPSDIGFFMFETLSSLDNCFGQGFGHQCYQAVATTGFTPIFSSEPDTCTNSGCPSAAFQAFMSAYGFFPNPSGTTTAPMSTNAGSWTEILLASPSQTPIYSCQTSSTLSQVDTTSFLSVLQVTNGSSVTTYLTADGTSATTHLTTDGTSQTTSTDGSSTGTTNGHVTVTTTVYANTTSTFTANVTTTTTTVDTTVTTYSVTNETYTVFNIINSYTEFVNCTTSGSYITSYSTYVSNDTTVVTSTIITTLFALYTTFSTTITTGVANPQDLPNLIYALLIIIIMLAFAVIVLVRRSGYLGGGGRYIS